MQKKRYSSMRDTFRKMYGVSMRRMFSIAGTQIAGTQSSVFHIAGTQTGRFSSVRSAQAAAIDEFAVREAKRVARLDKGWKHGLELGVCHECVVSLACASGAVYDIHRCMECRRTHVYFKAKDTLTTMQCTLLPKTEQCQAATHHAEAFICPICVRDEKERT